MEPMALECRQAFAEHSFEGQSEEFMLADLIEMGVIDPNARQTPVLQDGEGKRERH
jgi:hypothetical protein